MFESEERRIVRRIKDFIKNEYPPQYYYIMLRNGRILNIDDYHSMVDSGKINPQDAHVYIVINKPSLKSLFLYQFLFWGIISLIAFLSKLHFRNGDLIVPATGLKYVAVAGVYGDYLSIEVINLDTAVNNLNLRKIVVEVLDGKLVSGEKELTKEEYEEFRIMFGSQRLFAGHTPGKAWEIIHDYYDNDNKSLAKEVARITIDYYRIFQPYTVCYETETWKEIDCSTIA